MIDGSNDKLQELRDSMFNMEMALFYFKRAKTQLEDILKQPEDQNA